MKNQTEKLLNEFYPIQYPFCISIERLNMPPIYGRIEHFDDKNQLAEKGQFRFVQNGKAEAFNKELLETGKMSTDYSTLINLKDIKNMQLVKII